MADVPPALGGGGAVLSRAAASELRAPVPPPQLSIASRFLSLHLICIWDIN